MFCCSVATRHNLSASHFSHDEKQCGGNVDQASPAFVTCDKKSPARGLPGFAPSRNTPLPSSWARGWNHPPALASVTTPVKSNQQQHATTRTVRVTCVCSRAPLPQNSTVTICCCAAAAAAPPSRFTNRVAVNSIRARLSWRTNAKTWRVLLRAWLQTLLSREQMHGEEGGGRQW